jgi:hypothetical protein
MDQTAMTALAEQVARNQQQLAELMQQQQSLLQSQMLMMQQQGGPRPMAAVVPPEATPAPMFAGMSFAAAPAFSFPASDGGGMNSGAIAGLFS